jgi:hypothetical protein
VLPREILELQYRQLTINHYRLTDNQSSSPALTFPNVPDDFCPTGNWQNVFQVFIDEVLTNGTINVPGLGDVTPAQIAQIQEDLVDQQNQISALQTELETETTEREAADAALDTRIDALENVKIQRGRITGVADDDSEQTVTLSPALSTTSYSVMLTPVIPTGGIGTNAPIIGIKSGSKTITEFIISIQNNGITPNIDEIEWLVIKP